MLRKVRYHHENFNPYGNAPWNRFASRGITFKFSPVDQTTVNVQFTLCSTKDNFCKRTAREAVENKEIFTIPVSELPKYIATTRLRALYGDRAREPMRGDTNAYAWIWKYFL